MDKEHENIDRFTESNTKARENKLGFAAPPGGFILLHDLVGEGAGQPRAVGFDVGLGDDPVFDDQGESLAANSSKGRGKIKLEVQGLSQAPVHVRQQSDFAISALNTRVPF